MQSFFFFLAAMDAQSSKSFSWEGKHPPLMVSGIAILVPASYTNQTMLLILGGPIEHKLPADYSVLWPLTMMKDANTKQQHKLHYHVPNEGHIELRQREAHEVIRR